MGRVKKGLRKGHKCPECDKVCITPSKLEDHKHVHSHWKTIECKLCKKMFKFRSGLTYHMNTKHSSRKDLAKRTANSLSEEKGNQEIGNLQESSSSEKNVNLQEKVTENLQKSCSSQENKNLQKKFNHDYENVDRHAEYEETDRKEENFGREPEANEEQDLENEADEFDEDGIELNFGLCRYCKKCFSDNDLWTHEQKCAKAKVHICPVCKKTFRKRFSWQTHLRSHSNEKAFPCESCSKSFKYKHGLARHVRYQHVACSEQEKMNLQNGVYHFRRSAKKEYDDEKENEEYDDEKDNLGEESFKIEEEDLNSMQDDSDNCSENFEIEERDLNSKQDNFEIREEKFEIGEYSNCMKDNSDLGKEKFEIEGRDSNSMKDNFEIREEYFEIEGDSNSKQDVSDLGSVSNSKPNCKTCRFCDKRNTDIKLCDHQCTRSKPHQCQECGQVFKRHCRMLDHQHKHSTEKSFSCKICVKKFKFRTGLKRHVKEKHDDVGGEEMINQTIVSEIDNIDTLEGVSGQHLSILNGSEVSHSVPKESNSNYIDEGQLSTRPSERELFPCQSCSKVFKFRTGLQRHTKEKHPDGIGEHFIQTIVSEIGMNIPTDTLDGVSDICSGGSPILFNESGVRLSIQKQGNSNGVNYIHDGQLLTKLSERELFLCLSCPKKFKFRTGLQRHIKEKHSDSGGEYNFEQSIVNETHSFQKESKVKQHYGGGEIFSQTIVSEIGVRLSTDTVDGENISPDGENFEQTIVHGSKMSLSIRKEDTLDRLNDGKVQRLPILNENGESHSKQAANTFNMVENSSELILKYSNRGVSRSTQREDSLNKNENIFPDEENVDQTIVNESPPIKKEGNLDDVNDLDNEELPTMLNYNQVSHSIDEDSQRGTTRKRKDQMPKQIVIGTISNIDQDEMAFSEQTMKQPKLNPSEERYVNEMDIDQRPTLLNGTGESPSKQKEDSFNNAENNIVQASDGEFSHSTQKKNNSNKLDEYMYQDQEESAFSDRNKPHKCPKCPRRFWSPFDMREHQYKHSDVRSFVCKLCSKAFKFRSGLVRHHRQDHNVTMKGLKILKKNEMNSETQMSSRKDSGSSESSSLWGKNEIEQDVRSSDSVEIRHQENVISQVGVHNSTQSLTTPSFTVVQEIPPKDNTIAESELPGPSEEKHVTEYQSVINENLSSLSVQKHLSNLDKSSNHKYREEARYSQKTKFFKCPHCPQRFLTEYEMRGHQYKHSDFKSFVCDLCSKAFKFRTGLVRHIRQKHNLSMADYGEMTKPVHHSNDLEPGKASKGSNMHENNETLQDVIRSNNPLGVRENDISHGQIPNPVLICPPTIPQGVVRSNDPLGIRDQENGRSRGQDRISGQILAYPPSTIVQVEIPPTQNLRSNSLAMVNQRTGIIQERIQIVNQMKACPIDQTVKESELLLPNPSKENYDNSRRPTMLNISAMSNSFEESAMDQDEDDISNQMLTPSSTIDEEETPASVNSMKEPELLLHGRPQEEYVYGVEHSQLPTMVNFSELSLSVEEEDQKTDQTSIIQEQKETPNQILIGPPYTIGQEKIPYGNNTVNGLLRGPFEKKRAIDIDNGHNKSGGLSHSIERESQPSTMEQILIGPSFTIVQKQFPPSEQSTEELLLPSPAERGRINATNNVQFPTLPDESGLSYSFRDGDTLNSVENSSEDIFQESSQEEVVFLDRHKIHKCPQCPKRFWTSFDMHEHRYKHSDIKSFVCKLCSKAFKFRSGLVRHLRQDHNVTMKGLRNLQKYEIMNAEMESLRNRRKEIESSGSFRGNDELIGETEILVNRRKEDGVSESFTRCENDEIMGDIPGNNLLEPVNQQNPVSQMEDQMPSQVSNSPSFDIQADIASEITMKETELSPPSSVEIPSQEQALRPTRLNETHNSRSPTRLDGRPSDQRTTILNGNGECPTLLGGRHGGESQTMLDGTHNGQSLIILNETVASPSISYSIEGKSQQLLINQARGEVSNQILTSPYSTIILPSNTTSKEPDTVSNQVFTSPYSTTILPNNTNTMKEPNTTVETLKTRDGFEYILQDREEFLLSQGKKVYKCPDCPKVFPTGRDRRKHSYKHNDVKSFVCKLCSKAFKFHTSLGRHVKDKHDLTMNELSQWHMGETRNVDSNAKESTSSEIFNLVENVEDNLSMDELRVDGMNRETRNLDNNAKESTLPESLNLDENVKIKQEPRSNDSSELSDQENGISHQDEDQISNRILSATIEQDGNPPKDNTTGESGQSPSGPSDNGQYPTILNRSAVTGQDRNPPGDNTIEESGLSPSGRFDKGELPTMINYYTATSLSIEKDLDNFEKNSEHDDREELLNLARKKLYKCPHCLKTFTTGRDMRKHAYKHSDVKTFVCKLCLKAFKFNTGLSRHVKEKHHLNMDEMKRLRMKGMSREARMLREDGKAESDRYNTNLGKERAVPRKEIAVPEKEIGVPEKELAVPENFNVYEMNRGKEIGVPQNFSETGAVMEDVRSNSGLYILNQVYDVTEGKDKTSNQILASPSSTIDQEEIPPDDTTMEDVRSNSGLYILNQVYDVSQMKDQISTQIPAPIIEQEEIPPSDNTMKELSQPSTSKENGINERKDQTSNQILASQSSTIIQDEIAPENNTLKEISQPSSSNESVINERKDRICNHIITSPSLTIVQEIPQKNNTMEEPELSQPSSSNNDNDINRQAAIVSNESSESGSFQENLNYVDNTSELISSVLIYKCPDCPRRFSSAHKRQKHSYKHSDMKTFVCELCSKAFKFNTGLARHVKQTHNLTMNELTELRTEDKDSYTRLLRNDLGQSTVSESELPSTSRERRTDVIGLPSTSREKHIIDNGHHPTMFNETTASCTIGMDLNNVAYGFEHHRNMPKTITQYRKGKKVKKLYPCPDCQRVFTRPHERRKHSYMHSDIKSFVCALCSKAFKFRNGLGRHVKEKHNLSMNELKNLQTDGMIRKTEMVNCDTVSGSIDKEEQAINNVADGQIPETETILDESELSREVPTFLPEAETILDESELSREVPTFLPEAEVSHLKRKSVNRERPTILKSDLSHRVPTILKTELSHSIKENETSTRVGNRSENTMQETAHGGKAFVERHRIHQCPQCPRRFWSPFDLHKHSYKHSDIKYFTCELCSKSFKFRTGLGRHMKKQHNLSMSGLRRLRLEATKRESRTSRGKGDETPESVRRYENDKISLLSDDSLQMENQQNDVEQERDQITNQILEHHSSTIVQQEVPPKDKTLKESDVSLPSSSKRKCEADIVDGTSKKKALAYSCNKCDATFENMCDFLTHQRVHKRKR